LRSPGWVDTGLSAGVEASGADAATVDAGTAVIRSALGVAAARDGDVRNDAAYVVTTGSGGESSSASTICSCTGAKSSAPARSPASTIARISPSAVRDPNR